MEALDNESSNTYRLQVQSSFLEKKDYFLRGIKTFGYLDQLDFNWQKKQQTKASISIALTENGEAHSLPNAPFGGFWTDSSLSSSSAEEFIAAVVMELKLLGISFLKIVQAPKNYDSNQALINYLLFKMGFEIEGMLSHHFFVGRKKMKKLFENESARLQVKMKEEGLRVSSGPVNNFGFLKEIKAWNLSRGYVSNFDESGLIQQVSDFPERYFLLTVSREGLAAAHSLAVKLTGKSIYYYLSAVDPKANLRHGGDLLLTKLFELAYGERCEFIDLGSSDLEKRANHSLMFFKSRFSNDISNKITWTKRI